MGFISDTAGALGVLGTVWGIFETFHGGKLDGPTILQGMSVSLVTTLVGLVISLVLNAGATSVFSLFNKQLSLLASRAEELRQALLFIENKQTAAAKSARTVHNGAHFSHKPKPPAEGAFQFSHDSGSEPYEENAVPAGYEQNGTGWS